MKTFLIILAVLVLLTILICSLSATVTLVYNKSWHTRIKILFFEKDVVLSEILSFVLFPEKKAKDTADKSKKKKENKKAEKEKSKQTDKSEKNKASDNGKAEIIKEQGGSTAVYRTGEPEKKIPAQQKITEKPKANPLKKMWDDEGIVGIMLLVSNLLETANSAISTLIRGLHIYSLYVMILIGGGDADVIARSYGTVCKYYYPLKGMILNGMKVDNYDDYIQPDFLADKTEVEFQLIGSVSVGLLLKVGLKAVYVFLKNLIKNKKGD